MRWETLSRALIPALLLAASVASATGFGINAHIPNDPVSDRIEAAGIEWVRIDFLWLLVEPERDVYDWSLYDALVDRLEARGVRIFAGIGATPAWATSGSEFSGVPDEVGQWRELCYLAARRYAGRIDAWGLWNEPNLDRFWVGSRQQYLDLILVPGAEAIALADPSALVCGPDLAHLSSADWDDWLRASIDAASDLLDVVTHHVYPSNGFASEVTFDLEEGGPFPFSPPSVKDVLRDTDWWGRPFWLTETGVESHRWGEGRQASFIDNLLEQWFAPTRGDRSWVDRVYFYEMNDTASPSAYTFGLLYGPPELEPKEAYHVYSQRIAEAVVDDAELLASGIPVFFEPGQTVRTTVTLRNTGTTTWRLTEAIRLVVEVDTASWAATVEQLMPADAVDPGESHDFDVEIIAPGGPASKQIGSHPILTARMEREGAWRFGDLLRHQVLITNVDPPEMTRQPESSVVVPGAVTTVRVDAAGSEPLTYRWLRNGTGLDDGPQYSGTDTPVLTVTALSHEVAAFYQCIVSNDAGTVVSDAATVGIGQPAPRPGGGRVRPRPSPTPATPPEPALPRWTGPPLPR